MPPGAPADLLSGVPECLSGAAEEARGCLFSLYVPWKASKLLEPGPPPLCHVKGSPSQPSSLPACALGSPGTASPQAQPWPGLPCEIHKSASLGSCLWHFPSPAEAG